jgi:acid phosphatase (class A)
MTKQLLWPAAGTFIFTLLIWNPGLSQKNAVRDRALVAPRGHYATLQKLSSEKGKENAEWDLKKFPFDAAGAERRLSLKPYYLQNISPDFFKIPEPPANSSEQTRGELNYLLQLQLQRRKIDVDASLEMAGIYYNLRIKPSDSAYNHFRKNLFFIGRSVGTWFHPDSLPVTANFIAHVWQDASYYIWALKYKHLRVRPYVLEPRLNNLEDTDWAAYPSGHATNSYVNAFIYQELAPEFSDVFMTDAYDMAHSREIIGVHYPSDSEAGRMLARQLVNLLFANQKFLDDLEQVKAEWATRSKGYYGAVEISGTGPATEKKSCGAPTQAKGTACKTD